MVMTPKQEQASQLEKAWVRYNKKDFEGALAIFEEMLEEQETPEALYGRACSLFRCEEYDDALKHLNILIKAHPNDLKYLHTRALIHGAEEKVTEAIRDLEKVVAKTPDSIEAWFDLGMSYLLQKDYSRALECFDNGIDLDKSCPDAWLGKGLVALEKKENKKAVEYLNAAIKLDGRYILALLARAEAQLLLNMKPDAHKDIAKVLSLEPGIFKHAELDSESDDSDFDDEDGIDEDEDLESFKMDE